MEIEQTKYDWMIPKEYHGNDVGDSHITTYNQYCDELDEYFEANEPDHTKTIYRLSFEQWRDLQKVFIVASHYNTDLVQMFDTCEIFEDYVNDNLSKTFQVLFDENQPITWEQLIFNNWFVL